VEGPVEVSHDSGVGGERGARFRGGEGGGV